MNFASLNSESSNKYIGAHGWHMWNVYLNGFTLFLLLFAAAATTTIAPPMGQVNGELFQIFSNSYAWICWIILNIFLIAWATSKTIYFTMYLFSAIIFYLIIFLDVFFLLYTKCDAE